jgi:hypothetical protein
MTSNWSTVGSRIYHFCRQFSIKVRRTLDPVEAFENVAATRRITGRPCGQVVGEDVFSKRSMSQRIFSGESGMLTLMAAWYASEVNYGRVVVPRTRAGAISISTMRRRGKEPTSRMNLSCETERTWKQSAAEILSNLFWLSGSSLTIQGATAYRSFQSVTGTTTLRGRTPIASSLTITAGRVFLISPRWLDRG